MAKHESSGNERVWKPGHRRDTTHDCLFVHELLAGCAIIKWVRNPEEKRSDCLKSASAIAFLAVKNVNLESLG